tara:strand:+ start:2998 stop:3138 length:141 start_codon:yes stop_codon:yes gene_type:complete
MINKRWLFWLTLVIFWNYRWPKVDPIWDVIVAVVLSLSFIYYKKPI